MVEICDLADNIIDCNVLDITKPTTQCDEVSLQEIILHNRAVRYAMGILWYYDVIEPISDNCIYSNTEGYIIK